MNIQLQILNANGEVVNTAVALNTAGQATLIPAQSGQRFQLIDGQTGFAPENIEVKRVGDDLHIAFEGQTIGQPGLILQDYYNTAGDGTDNLVVGMHENGQIYPYVPETAQTNEAIHQLAQSVSSTQALGGSVAYAAAVPPLWPLIGAGLLGIGGLAALAGGGGGGDDDSPAAPAATLSGPSNVNESIGTVNYTVTLDKPAAADTSFTYTITPTAPTGADDFTGPLTGTVTIPQGQSSAVIPVGIDNDDLYEGPETYTLTLSNPQNATIKQPSVTTTIWDNGTTDGSTPGSTPPDPNNPNAPFDTDDDRPTVSISGVPSVNEGAGAVEYTVSLDKPSAVDTTVTLTVAHGNTDDADLGARGARTETVTIPAGQTSAKVYVDIANDTEYESGNGPEQYSVSIADPVNAKLGNASVTTQIWDNGTTDGTTPGNTPPQDPNNPTPPFNTDDDRPLTFDPGTPVKVVEGAPAESGMFKIGPMEFTKLTIGGNDIGINAMINASPEYPHTVAIGGGEAFIAITGYDKTTGEVSYIYRSEPQQHSQGQGKNLLPDSIEVTAHNINGKTIVGTLSFTIEDTVWKANHDTNAADQNQTVLGNVLANDQPDSNVGGIHADDKTVTGITKGQVAAANGEVGKVIDGDYGQLTVNADGSYSYIANKAQHLAEGEPKDDIFTYTLTDADGDSATAQLTIKVTGKNDAPVAQDGQNSVTENSVNTQVIQTNASDPDANDSIRAYEITDISSSGYTANGISVSFSFSKNPDGSWTITNNASLQNGKISIGTDGKISIDETGLNIGGKSVFDTLPEGTKLDLAIQYQATDSHGEKSNVATHTVTVQGIDDAALLNSSKAQMELDQPPRIQIVSPSARNDVDTGEGYLAKSGAANNRLQNGDLIQGRYGDYEVISSAPTSGGIYTMTYTAHNHIALDAIGNTLLSQTGTPIVLHDYLNVVSYGGGKLTVEGEHGSAYLQNNSASSITAKSATQLATDGEDAYYINGDLNAALDTKAANDAVYVTGKVRADVDLGDGDDYFYAEGNVSSTVNGGNGNDTFILFGKDNDGIIDGGAGKDALILAADTTLGDGNLQLSIKNIEVIDTRQGKIGTTDTTDIANTVTITEKALLDNGTDISIFAGSADTINIDVADTASITQNGNVYTYNGNNVTYTITDELNIGINIV